MYESHSDKVLRLRRKWNAKNPARARRIAWAWRIYWCVDLLAAAGAVSFAVSTGDAPNVIVVVIMGAGVIGIAAGILGAIFSSIRHEPSDGSPVHVEPGG